MGRRRGGEEAGWGGWRGGEGGEGGEGGRGTMLCVQRVVLQLQHKHSAAADGCS